jgi:sulfate/thiosulfate transport system permease protein
MAERSIRYTSQSTDEVTSSSQSRKIGTSRRRRVLPGFGLTLGFTMLYLGLFVLVPLSTIFIKAAGLGWDGFWATVTTPRVLAAYRLSFLTAFVAALVNVFFGFLVAWVLVRYRFPGRRLADAIVDLPFALPTAVAGIAFTALYAENGWVGSLLLPLGVKVAYTQLGIAVVLTFIGLPFVVRTLQPVLESLEPEVEEAASSLGATRLATFRRVLFPAIWPALLTGFTLAFARAIGEYGSVVFIAGNMPMKTEIAPLLIMAKLDQFEYEGAAAVSGLMLIVSFILLLTITALQRFARRQTT